jgi:HPt (histidine-containing phosphotransfer) domain-containing protein
MKGDEEKCLAAGCSAFLPKPIELHRLMELLAKILGGEVRKSPPRPAESPHDESSTPTSDAASRTIPLAAAAENERKSTRRIVDKTISAQAVADASSKFNGAPLLSDLPMDDEEFRDIVVEFVERLKLQLDHMESAADAGDFVELGNLAHWLKGSGGTAGFPAFTQPAAELERQAKAGEAARIPVSIQCLRDLTERIYIPVHINAEAT